mgnify:CR=1 FL=1
MIRRPPRSTLDRSSAASDVYKRQGDPLPVEAALSLRGALAGRDRAEFPERLYRGHGPVSYTHLRAHETVLDIVCRLLLEKKNKTHKLYLYNDTT